MAEEKYPIIVEKDSVLIHPKLMKIGKMYPVTLNGETFLYCKISDGVIQIWEENETNERKER